MMKRVITRNFTPTMSGGQMHTRLCIQDISQNGTTHLSHIHSCVVYKAKHNHNPMLVENDYIWGVLQIS